MSKNLILFFIILLFGSVFLEEKLNEEINLNPSSEVSWISNFGESRIPKNCPDYQNLTDMANKIKKISLEDSGNIIQVIMSSYMNEDQEILMRSSEQYNLPYIMIGLCQEWRGLGDKILRVRDLLRLMKSGEAKQLGFDPARFNDIYIQFTDAWDVLVVNQPKKLESTYVSQFNKNSIVFMGETACWPDEDLKSSYPETTSEFKYLNSGVYFGPASRILHLYEDYPIQSYGYDDQLYYTKALFTNNYNIVIDYKKQMFGSLHGYSNFEDIYEMETNTNGEYRLISKVYDSKSKQFYKAYPVLVHGHGPIAGPSKNNLRLLQNFFPSTKTNKAPYLALPPLPSTESTGKKILISLFLYSDQPFFEMFIGNILSLEHKKEDIVLYINYFAGNDSNPLIESWLNDTDKLGYKKVIKTFDENIRNAKISALKATVSEDCDFYFTTDALITKKDILSNLISEDKFIIFPLITGYDSIYSNFWGAFNFDNGYYKRHAFYKQIAEYKTKGIFGVSVAWGSYLVKASHAELFSKYYLDEPGKNNRPLREMYKRSETNPWWLDIYFSAKLGVDRPVYITNREHFGYLIERIPLEKSNGRLHKELYAYDDNKYLWKKYYYSEEFFNYIFKDQPLNYTEACDDVFVWQFFKPIFGIHLYEEAEHFGEWSGGGHKQQTDPRIGGVEHYPTQDIHLNQFGLHDTWLDIIKTDIAKFAAHLYSDTATKGINIAFIVRYKPGAQSFLRPHHDSSLYTVAVALNKPGRDFQGGGVRFVRRNCTYIPPESGYSLIHPGRVTHRHEGLETTNGTRYIFVTFVE